MDKPRSFAPIIAAVLLLLPVLYMGSYLVLVKPGPRFGWGSAIYPTYRVADGFCTRLFWPLEQIDRKLRPAAWEPEVFFLGGRKLTSGSTS
jgi:hypothetical protein